MKILDNPVYTGKIAYGKNVTEKVKGTRDEYRRVKTDDYLLADGLHEAIVDEETWEAAREKRKRTGVRFVKTHSLEHEHILKALTLRHIQEAKMAVREHIDNQEITILKNLKEQENDIQRKVPGRRN